jgi:CRISPR-associated endoribonuclease Cas2 subtype I-E
MTVVVTRNVPGRFSGFLASCMCEIAPGVYTAPRMSAAVRDRVWNVLTEWFQGDDEQGLLMTWPDPTKPGGQAIEVLGWPRQEIEEHAGVFLVRRSVAAVAADSPEVAEAADWLKGLAEKTDWLVLDVETTGTGPEAEPIEVVVLASDGSVVFSSLIRPGTAIDPEATSVHGLAAEDLESAPTFVEVEPALRRAIEGHRVIAYNAVFDRRCLRTSCVRARLPEIQADWNCALDRYEQRRGVRLALREACRTEGIEVEILRRLADGAKAEPGSLTTESA